MKASTCGMRFDEALKLSQCLCAIRDRVFAFTIIALVIWHVDAACQTAVNTYMVNDGNNGTFDQSNGEFAPDLNGYLPFSQYSKTSHYYAMNGVWNFNNAFPGRTFLDEMFLNMTDLRQLDADIKAATPSTVQRILPFPSNVAFLESGTNPVDAMTWWNQPFRMWRYRINGAPMLICVKLNSLGGTPQPANPAKILFRNYAEHSSSFGSNKNRFVTTAEFFQEFHEPDPEAGWSGGSTPVLGIEEQALAAGDVVVSCQEAYSESIWFALQRTQEAEEFVRNQFIPTTLGVGVGYSFLYGGSWGGVVSAIFALLQPKIYAASTSWTVSDMGYAIGDRPELVNFQFGALGMLPPSSTALDVRSAEINALVDMLGIRFDGTPAGQWDVAALSSNRRGDLGVKVYGLAHNEDPLYNGFWSLDDSSINPKFEGHLRKFMEHGAAWGVVPGKNEYAFYGGNEWSNITSNASTATNNVSLIPAALAPTGSTPVYPDPYSHTLRHDSHLSSNVAFLTPLDLGPAGHPNQASSIKTLGQGVWPGYRDSMRVADVDGDSRPEIVFGNLDGFVHDLEFNNDANDMFRLTDQFKSNYLGRGVFSSAGAGQGTGSKGYFANSRGQVWKMTYNGGITIDPTPFITADGSFTYDGEVPYLFVGNFDTSSPDKELFLLNRFLDWSLFSTTDGSHLSRGRLLRNTHAIGAGQAAQLDITNDVDLELLVPAADGHVWLLDPANGFPPNFKPLPYISTFTTGTGNPRALYRIDAANFGSTNSPTHILIFGRNDDLNDSNPAVSTNVMMLYTAGSTPAFVGKGLADPGDAFNTSMSFAWTIPPVNGASYAEFVVSGGSELYKYQVTTSGVFTCTGSCPMVSFNPEYGNPNAVTSIVTTPIGGTVVFIVVALGNGRVFVLDSNLQFVRNSDREAAGLSNPTSWISNRSLGHCMTTDLAQTSDGMNADLYFADYSNPFRVVSGTNKYRLGRLHLPIGSTPTSWVPYVSDVINPAVEDQFRGANRTLLYRDIDGDGQRETRVLAETGTAYKDPATGIVREFCTFSYAADFNYDATLGSPYSGRYWKGGNVFEYFQPNAQSSTSTYNYLGGFNVPRDTSTPFEDFSGSDWWYPKTGIRLSGQISNYSQSALSFQFGTSMKTAMIRPFLPPTTAAVPHVVVGTNGGMVYAIRPGPQPSSRGLCSSQLGYASPCLGMYVIGMDVGDLDGDPDDEIVVGEWIDKGTYVDWLASKQPSGSKTKNRAPLRILDPVLPTGGTGAFNVTSLYGDDLLGAGNGLGAGVTGVKIDDVNHDGVPEMWCSDAIGHIYLFRKTGSSWGCFYRSTDLGACPGLYNQIFVMKDSNHKTTKLILVSSGYVMAFVVDPTLL